MSDRLNLPSVLVLDSCGISHAGDEEEVATFCAHVVELDLSHNQFRDWGEVRAVSVCTADEHKAVYTQCACI